jgi:transcriptional regulator with GAF, ATPase, and Fis domain
MSEETALLGASPAIAILQEEIRFAARSDAKVLISGESGVGKELAARLIHEGSPRHRRSLVAINCAGLQDTLLESELFGHVRGSFTDAYRDRTGLLELAHRGTVLLDEVGEMTLRMQGLLLRFLETGEIQRVGSTTPPSLVDVRVVAATNRDLAGAVRAGGFRQDLYYRLNVINLRIPPLRERRDDVPLLLQHFADLFGRRYGTARPRFSSDAVARLTAYAWPGNVRELKNLVERVVVRHHEGPVTTRDLPAELGGLESPAPAADAAAPSVSLESEAETLYRRMVEGRHSFWTAVYEPFMLRDLRREDLRRIVRLGLEETRGSYRGLVHLFNMEPDDYKRFMNCLRKHQCHVPFQPFRGALGRPLLPAGAGLPVPTTHGPLDEREERLA